MLNIAYNLLCGGTRLEHIELRRNDEVYLDALGTKRIPNPTTEGDFCRRFETFMQVEDLMEAINEARLHVWKQQPNKFFHEAVIDVDGTIAESDAERNRGTTSRTTQVWLSSACRFAGQHGRTVVFVQSQRQSTVVGGSGRLA